MGWSLCPQLSPVGLVLLAHAQLSVPWGGCRCGPMGSRMGWRNPNPNVFGVVLEVPTLSWVPDAIGAVTAAPTQSLVRSVTFWAPGRV